MIKKEIPLCVEWLIRYLHNFYAKIMIFLVSHWEKPLKQHDTQKNEIHFFKTNSQFSLNALQMCDQPLLQ